MTRKTTRWLALVLVGGAVAAWFGGRPAQGDATSDQALAAAVQRGQQLFTAAWKAGAKTCADCHASGPNRMTSVRIKSYPKYDKTWAKVLCAQQKINQMISTKAQGSILVLGSDDLNALEAYISTLR